MLKGGIFLDVENLARNGAWGMRYQVVRDLVAAQGVTVLRANAYVAIDEDREENDRDYFRRNQDFRNAIRRSGFHLVLKPVRRFTNDEGREVLKANADLDLAVDALLQADNLDYILLGSGDGDFLRLVRALQSRGKRVDLLSCDNTSRELRREADVHYQGALVPGLLPSRNADAPGRQVGFLHMVSERGVFSPRAAISDTAASTGTVGWQTLITCSRSVPMWRMNSSM